MNKNRWMFLGVLMLAVFVAFAPCVSAQESAAKGTLNGTVVDSTGGSIVGANVILTGPFGNQNQSTNGLGIFIFQDLIPGTYKVRIEMKGFRAAEVPDVTINVGRVSAIRVQLEPGSITSTVEVIASAVAVDTTSTAVATNLNDDFYNKLPVQRGVAGLFYLAPGVVSGGGTGAANPSIGGATGLENLYIADGVSITDTAFGGLGLYSRVYGSVGTGINLTFIKEVQIKTGSIQSQYGGATGGVVQIVTKSGGNQYHGAVGGYAQPYQFEAQRLDVDSFNLANPFGRVIHDANFDASGEIGGPVPLVGKDKLFFFGSFDPSWVNVKGISPPLEGNSLLGPVQNREISYNYAAKLTWKLNDKNTIEGSVFGDPTYSNLAPWNRYDEGITGFPNTTNFSKLDFGNRDVVARYNGTLSPTWVLNIDATWQHNKFTESGYDNADSRIIDQTQTCAGVSGGAGFCPQGAQNFTGTVLPNVQEGQFTAVGKGFVEDTRDESYGAHINTSKIVNFWGQHAIDVGYGYTRPYYDGLRANSGAVAIFPTLNQDNTSDGFGFQCTTTGTTNACPWATQTAGGVPTGSFANYVWNLDIVPGCPTKASATSDAVCALMNVPGLGAQPVALAAIRSEFSVSADGFKHFNTTGRNHAGYANDSWTINKYVTVNAGLRWQQENLLGAGLTPGMPIHYTFTDNWSPSLGVIVDPWGDRKTKLSFSFGRYNYNLPLDLAERSLTNELDLFSQALVPDFHPCPGASSPVPCTAGDRVVTLNGFGTVTPIIDSAHVLNNAFGSPFNASNGGAVFGSTESLEAIHHATRLTYEDEYVMGFEHEFSHGVILSARYMHRSLRRIVEDEGGIPPEAAKAGIGQQFTITNPHKTQDLYTNPQEFDFNGTQPVPDAASPSGFAFPTASVSGIPTQCVTPGSTTDAIGLPTSDVPAFNFPTNSFGQGIFDSQGHNAACFISTGLGVNLKPEGSVVPDGIPDGFVDPIHKYWAVVFEVNKSFSHNWQLRANYTISKVFGNFEGAFRNDNGQSDPGISSLFDFTPGNFGELGGQFTPGILNQDRQQVANGYFSYVFDHGMLKNLTLGTGATVATGTPITELASHPVYLNNGEIPIGGRGALGRTPTTGFVNFHTDYLWSMTERFHLRFGADLFNVANTKRIEYINQTIDLSFGTPNADFLKPNNILGSNPYQGNGIQAPFNCRLFARIEF
jgi:hypothetical protein